MVKRITRSGIDASKFVVDAAKVSTSVTLEGVRAFLGGAFSWSSERLKDLSGVPLISGTGLSAFLRQSGEGLENAGNAADDALARALAATGEKMREALQMLDVTDEVVHRNLFENMHITSVVGESFAGISLSSIRPSFRLNGKDTGSQEIFEDWKKSGLKKVIVCVPGLFCDESLWGEDNEPSVVHCLKECGYYPVFVRFNPGNHVSTNGAALLEMLNELLNIVGLKNSGEKIHFITYSQGGIILRSTLYQARSSGKDISSRTGTVVFISSPDGGSYIEKIGFWLGLGLEKFPLFPVQMAGLIGNQRSDAMKDLSHGIIREEDWKNADQIKRYTDEKYFGELDDIDAYQIYSLVSEKESEWSSWIGDGVVEKPSLTLLSDRVFRKKSGPDERVTVLFQKSHFQIIEAPETRELIRKILSGGGFRS